LAGELELPLQDLLLDDLILRSLQFLIGFGELRFLAGR
jgi:hypothetical protein